MASGLLWRVDATLGTPSEERIEMSSPPIRPVSPNTSNIGPPRQATGRRDLENVRHRKRSDDGFAKAAHGSGQIVRRRPRSPRSLAHRLPTAVVPSADVLLIPSSVNAVRAEHRQLPGVGALIVSDEIRVAVRASEFEVPVVGRQPRVKHFHDGDATISKTQRAWRLLAAVACITLDANAKQLPISHRMIVRR
jgi:hypothetical protein